MYKTSSWAVRAKAITLVCKNSVAILCVYIYSHYTTESTYTQWPIAAWSHDIGPIRFSRECATMDTMHLLHVQLVGLRKAIRKA